MPLVTSVQFEIIWVTLVCLIQFSARSETFPGDILTIYSDSDTACNGTFRKGSLLSCLDSSRSGKTHPEVCYLPAFWVSVHNALLKKEKKGLFQKFQLRWLANGFEDWLKLV